MMQKFSLAVGPVPRPRWLWNGQFLFACYAAGFASFMLLGILALPFAEYRVIEAMFRPYGGYVLLCLAFLWSTLIFRYLK